MRVETSDPELYPSWRGFYEELLQIEKMLMIKEAIEL